MSPESPWTVSNRYMITPVGPGLSAATQRPYTLGTERPRRRNIPVLDFGACSSRSNGSSLCNKLVQGELALRGMLLDMHLRMVVQSGLQIRMTCASIMLRGAHRAL